VRGNKRLVVSLVLLTLVFSLFGAIEFPTSVANNSNDVLSSTIPILYGDHSFRERILERTQGERDPIALVLSGGSARAFAHIGVLKYLEEEGIVPDLIISNSMGSMVGILYAYGLSPDQIYTMISQLDISKLFDLTMPIAGGMLDTARFTSLIASYLGRDVRIEEFPIPIMVISEDIATKRQVRIMEGKVIEVLEAAFALPVYFPPVNYRGHLLIDGGVANIVPLGVAYDYSDTVIVSTTFYEGKGTNLRNPLTILNTALDIGKRRQGVFDMENHSDAIWIRCDVEDFSFMDFKAIKEITMRGYASAAEKRGELQGIESGTVDDSLIEIRHHFSQKQAKVINNYRLFGQVKQWRLSHLLYVGLATKTHQHGTLFLRDEVVFGLFYNLKWKSLAFALQGGGGWQSLAPMELYPNLTASLTFQPFPNLMLEGDFNVAFDRGAAPTLYSRLALLGKTTFLKEELKGMVEVSWENQLLEASNLEKMLFHAGVTLEWYPPSYQDMVLKGEAAFQMGGRWDRQFIHTKVKGLFPLPLGFIVEAGYMGRFALDGGGRVPLYRNDGFRTNNTKLLTQGDTGSTTVSPANYLVVARFGLDWMPQTFKPTSGELLIFEDSAIGLYGDLLFNGEGTQFTYGGRIHTTISLLGLKSLPTSLYVGYDGPSEALFWGIALGVEF
jgi:NTE family protein